ncbi:MAG: hypothetical protein NTX87_20585 [Planctomycetota bacterium]|nr:hypothetical protein [Planctomycetota bacterium]
MYRVDVYHAFLEDLRGQLGLTAFRDQQASWPKRWILALPNPSGMLVQVGFHRSNYFHGDGDHSTVFLTVSVTCGQLATRAREVLTASDEFRYSARKDALYAQQECLRSMTEDAEQIILRSRRDELLGWALAHLDLVHRALIAS